MSQAREVAAAEREECAKVCQDVVESGMYDGWQQYAAAACRDEILARGAKVFCKVPAPSSEKGQS